MGKIRSRIKPGDFVKVYYNFHKKCLSVVKDGKVVAYVDSIYLKNVQFTVSEAGRQRSIRERQKNVHAFVQGEIFSINKKRPGKTYCPISYNPYKYGHFYMVEMPSEWHPVETAYECWIGKTKIFVDEWAINRYQPCEC